MHFSFCQSGGAWCPFWICIPSSRVPRQDVSVSYRNPKSEPAKPVTSLSGTPAVNWTSVPQSQPASSLLEVPSTVADSALRQVDSI